MISAVFRAQADALEIEAQAKRRLADEYDAANPRTREDNLRRGPDVPDENVGKPTAADLGLSRKEIHEARQFRDAEREHPGIVRETLDAKLAAGEEPTRSALRAAGGDGDLMGQPRHIARSLGFFRAQNSGAKK